MKQNDVVLEVKPEEVLADAVTETVDEAAKAPKFDAKKGLLLTGLVLTGLVVGYGAFKGAKWAIGKVKAKKAAKAEAEPETEETTEK